MATRQPTPIRSFVLVRLAIIRMALRITVLMSDLFAVGFHGRFTPHVFVVYHLARLRCHIGVTKMVLGTVIMVHTLAAKSTRFIMGCMEWASSAVPSCPATQPPS
jgi:hypothetical protein